MRGGIYSFEVYHEEKNKSENLFFGGGFKVPSIARL